MCAILNRNPANLIVTHSPLWFDNSICSITAISKQVSSKKHWLKGKTTVLQQSSFVTQTSLFDCVSERESQRAEDGWGSLTSTSSTDTRTHSQVSGGQVWGRKGWDEGLSWAWSMTCPGNGSVWMSREKQGDKKWTEGEGSCERKKEGKKKRVLFRLLQELRPQLGPSSRVRRVRRCEIGVCGAKDPVKDQGCGLDTRRRLTEISLS